MKLKQFQYIKITPSLADHWLEDYKYDMQRRLKSSWVDQLASAMSRGKFTENEIKLGRIGEDIRLVNGQHTLKAIVKSGITLRLPVRMIDFPSEVERGKYYANEDRPSRRTLVDGLVTLGIDESYGFITKRRRIAAAVKYILLGFPYTHAPGREEDFASIAWAMKEWKPAADRYFSCVSGSMISATLLRVDCLSIGIITFRDAPKRATAFWQGVASGNRSSPKASLVLYDWLRTPEARLLGPGGRSSNRLPSPGVNLAVAFRCIMQAWNAYFQRKPIKKFIYDSSLPIEFLGTNPFLHIPSEVNNGEGC